VRVDLWGLRPDVRLRRRHVLRCPGLRGKGVWPRRAGWAVRGVRQRQILLRGEVRRPGHRLSRARFRELPESDGSDGVSRSERRRGAGSRRQCGDVHSDRGLFRWSRQRVCRRGGNDPGVCPGAVGVDRDLLWPRNVPAAFLIRMGVGRKGIRLGRDHWASSLQAVRTV